MVNYKKAISPVVATALLLVVAVVAVVGFQTWFTTYQSGINVKVEQESNAGSAITIERLEYASATEAKVYLKSTSVGIMNVSVSIPEYCDDPQTVLVNANISSVVLTAGAGSCAGLEENAVYNVLATTEKGVFSASHIAR